jgi:surfactin family lipopeptide synthetase C
VCIDPLQSVLSWLQQLQAQQIESRQYEYSPLAQVQGWSEVPRGTPLFESLFVFENYPLDKSTAQPGKTRFEIQAMNLVEQTNYPLSVFIIPGQQSSMSAVILMLLQSNACCSTCRSSWTAS